jgi:FtsP/CotA-like multicopper oxidase with cupredoxin domain
MTQGRRIALIAAVVVIAVVAFIVLKPDEKKQTSSSSPTTTEPAPAGTTSKPAPPPVTQIKVVGGKPAGGIKTIDVNKGDQVRFTVTSDVGDEIHVHGYDFMKDVKPGGKVSFSFPAKIDGEFEIELESRAEQIAKLVVNP